MNARPHLRTRSLASAATLVLALFPALPALAATPESGSMSPGSGDLTWSGGPFTATTSDPVAADCNNSTCDNFLITVSGSDASTHRVDVEVTWLSPTNDLDLYVFDHTTGSQLDVDGAAASNVERVSFLAAPGVYRVTVLVYRAAQESYSGSATMVESSTTPEPPNEFRTAGYSLFDFGFKPEVKLPDQERSLVFVDQDVEPEIEIDRFGSIYIGAIRGIGGGVDFWRSDNGGESFQYLGEPDGTQNPSPPLEGGVGGGDVDLTLGPPFELVPGVGGNPPVMSTGRVWCSSLWLGSATMSVSVDRGETWAPFPFTTAQLDRQWHVASPDGNRLYMSLRKVSQLELDQNDVYVVQSDDGVTFTKGTFVQDPLSSVPDDLAGNLVITQEGFLVGPFVSRDGKDLYIYRSRTAPADLPLAPTEVSYDPNAFVVGHIFHGAGAFTTNNTFPIMAVDKGNNLHLVFSDRHNIYLISCPAGLDPTVAANWKKPVPLNGPKTAGFEFTTTALFPWITAGEAGKVAVIWYGTHVPGDADTPLFEEQAVPWKIVYAQVENALAETPDVYVDIASKQGGGVIHTGQICTRGLGCPDGTRELAEYSSLTLDHDGFANLAYTGTVIDGVDPPSTGAITFFTKTTRRPLRDATVLTRAECHDPRISRSGGWHDIEDGGATQGSYCRNVGAKKSNGGAYLEFRFQGSGVDLQIARGPRGGNAEIFIDGSSRGTVDFWRAPSDPVHPDNSGRKDLSFGEFLSFETGSGSHTFRLEVRNSSTESHRDMIYVDGIVIRNGDLEGEGDPTETSATAQGTVPGGTLVAPGVATHTVTASAATKLLTGVLEMSDGANLDLTVLDPAGAVLAASATLDPTEVTRKDPTLDGAYVFVVKNKGATPAEYRLSTVRTEPSGSGTMAAAMPASTHAEHAVHRGEFDPSGAIAYSVASGGHVLIRVFTVHGRLVRTLTDQVPGPGRHVTRWNGRSEDGSKLAKGVYLYRIRHPNGDQSTVKTVLLR
jgi:hypothetical protein